MGEFEGRVAIITGAGAGLGRSHAIGLAQNGAKVVVSDIALTGAEAVVSEIKAAGGEAIAAAVDVGDRAQVDAMVAKAIETWGRVDILVNNAGILRDKSFAKLEPADFDLVIKVHLQGTFNCIKAVWDLMREARYGRIVLTSSASGIYGNFGQSNYGAAKAAMIGMMNVLHLEGAKYDIRVNCLAPTAATNMTAGLISDEEAQLLSPRYGHAGGAIPRGRERSIKDDPRRGGRHVRGHAHHRDGGQVPAGERANPCGHRPAYA